MSDKNLIGFSYYGGKLKIAPTIINLISRIEHRHYVEPFFGSGAVFFNKPDSKFETINDIDSEITNFFLCLRERPIDLMRAIDLTPYSRDELARCCQVNDDDDDIERARKFIFKIHATLRRHHLFISSGTFARKTKVFNGVRRPHMWNTLHKRLEKMIGRLKTAQIENCDALKIINEFDSNETLFYLDPPYDMRTRNTTTKIYKHESDDDFQDKLIDALLNLKRARFVLSGYANSRYDEALAHCQSFTIKNDVGFGKFNANKKKKIAIEKIWTNANPDLTLF